MKKPVPESSPSSSVASILTTALRHLSNTARTSWATERATLGRGGSCASSVPISAIPPTRFPSCRVVRNARPTLKIEGDRRRLITRGASVDHVTRLPRSDRARPHCPEGGLFERRRLDGRLVVERQEVHRTNHVGRRGNRRRPGRRRRGRDGSSDGPGNLRARGETRGLAGSETPGYSDHGKGGDRDDAGVA